MIYTRNHIYTPRCQPLQPWGVSLWAPCLCWSDAWYQRRSIIIHIYLIYPLCYWSIVTRLSFVFCVCVSRLSCPCRVWTARTWWPVSASPTPPRTSAPHRYVHLLKYFKYFQIVQISNVKVENGRVSNEWVLRPTPPRDKCAAQVRPPFDWMARSFGFQKLVFVWK
jgi:hypothetical protein